MAENWAPCRLSAWIQALKLLHRFVCRDLDVCDVGRSIRETNVSMFQMFAN